MKTTWPSPYYGLPSVVTGIIIGVLVDRFPALRLMDNMRRGFFVVLIPRKMRPLTYRASCSVDGVWLWCSR